MTHLSAIHMLWYNIMAVGTLVPELGQNELDVLTTLKGNRRPQSAYDILHQLKSVDAGRIKAPTQVYRSLEKLVNQRLVHRIASQNAYIICDHPHHDFEPGFFSCRTCGSVTEFNLSEALGPIRCSSGAPRIDTINVEIEGICQTCVTASEAAA